MKTFEVRFTNLLFYSAILIFFSAFNLSDAPPPSGWYQQFMPDLGGKQLNDITFLDSLTGFAIASRNINPDTSSILKTTNGGNNWQIIFTQGRRRFSSIKFINSTTCFISGGSGSGTPYLYKTTDGGSNWFIQSSFGCAFWNDMFVLSNDTIWLVDSDGLCGGVFRTTNGGNNWEIQYQNPSDNPKKIYMYNGQFGFFGTSFKLFRTSNGGYNWTEIIGQDGFLDIYFVDSLNGWKAYGPIKRTTNGGLNWTNQTLPDGGIISASGINKLYAINEDTVWGTGGIVQFPNLQDRGILYRTTNGGTNWLFQLPDTSINIYVYYAGIQFYNNLIGWSFGAANGIHTVTGGDTTFYTGIQQTPNAVPEGFVLKQNYPNPFNPRTVIPYSLSAPAHVKIIAYDITGREVQRMVDNYQQAGTYEVDFMGKFTSTGVYFYRMTVTDAQSGQVYTDTKKMVLLK